MNKVYLLKNGKSVVFYYVSVLKKTAKYMAVFFKTI